MRHTLKLSAMIIFGATLPVWAGAGLPSLAEFDFGPYQAVLHGDASQLHIGNNTLSLDLVGVSKQGQVTLRLIGPAGEIVETPLKPLLVIGNPAAGHGAEHGDTHSDAAPHTAQVPALTTHASVDEDMAMDMHAAEKSSLGHVDVTPHSHEQIVVDDHNEAAIKTVSNERSSVRGRARVGASGVWRAELTIREADQIHTATVPLTAVPNGPSPIYLGVTGALMFGTVAYGALRRRFSSIGKGRG